MTKAIQVTGQREVEQSQPGAYSFVVHYSDRTKKAGMEFQCPCGCGLVGYLAFSGHGSPGPQWDWDGNIEKPTLSPSVFNTGFPCRWHGWLRNGEWVSC